MNNIITVKELCEFIWYLEDKHDLLFFDIDGVKPWQYYRVGFYYILTQAVNLFQKPHTTLTKIQKLKYSFTYLKNAIISNPFLARPVDIVIIPHNRVRKVNNKWIDIYTYYFEKHLLNNGVNFLELELPYLGKHFKETISYRKYLDLIILSSYTFMPFVKVDITEKQKKLIHEIEFAIKKELRNSIDLLSKFILLIKKFKIRYFLFKKLLKSLKSKQLYLVVSYDKGDFIKAAKDVDVETIEFQHGTFSKYHLGYYFPLLTEKLEYFPDKFYVWSDYWKNIIEFPISKNNVIVYGFPYLQEMKNRYKNISKKKGLMVILSQGALGEQIAKKICDNWDFFKDYSIKYKLHPGEYGRWKTYPSLVKLLNKRNVEILEEVDIYKLFAEAEYQVGVFSTALYEGIEFGCKTILLDLPGIEYMDYFIKKYKPKIF